MTVAGGAGRQRGFSIPCLSDDEGFVRVGKNGKKKCAKCTIFWPFEPHISLQVCFFDRMLLLC